MPYPRRASLPLTPESYRRAAVRLRKAADHIEARADQPERLTGPLQRLVDLSRSLRDRHVAERAERAPAATGYCRKCERLVPLIDDGATCGRCRLVL